MRLEWMHQNDASTLVLGCHSMLMLLAFRVKLARLSSS